MGRTKGGKNKVIRGSGNIFKDIGCKNPEKLSKESKKRVEQ
jgi:hypothetical protein